MTDARTGQPPQSDVNASGIVSSGGFGTASYHPRDVAIGRCGLCGGEVTTPEVWAGTNPPRSCSRCGATPQDNQPLPILAMNPPRVLCAEPIGYDANGPILPNPATETRRQ